MSNLKILLKNNFNIMLGRFQGKKQRASTLSAMIVLILCAVGIVALYTLQAKTMFDAFAGIGLADMLLFHALTVTVTVVVTIGVMRISVTQNSSDEWLLLSMPIKKSDIIISKVLNKYAFDLAMIALCFVPFLVLYLVIVEFSVRLMLFGTILTLLLPLLSIAISNILGYIVSKLFNKFRSANLYKSLISVFAFIMVYGLLLVKTSSYGLVEVASLEAFFSDRPVTYLLLKFILKPNALRVLLVLALTIIPFMIGMIFYGINFGKSSVGYHTNNTVCKFGTGKTVFGSMLKKEIYTYTTTTAYIINTIIGPILMLALSILIVISKDNGGIALLFGVMPENLIPGLMAMVFGFCVALTTISACSISLEGNSLWVLKSTPVNEKMLFLAKATLQLIIILPFVIASSVVIGVSMRLAILDWVIMMTIPTLLCVLFAFAGVLINLWLPLLEWEDETKVVKQSMAVLVAMLTGMAVAFIPLGVFKLFTSLSIINMFLICVGVYLLLIALVCTILFTWGVKQFRKL